MSARRLLLLATSRWKPPRRPLGARLVLLAPLALFAACGPEDSQVSRELYLTHCAECHAEDGRGDPRQRGLYPALDLTRSEMVQKRANGIIYRRIANGYGTMPGFSHKIEHQDLLRLTEYTMSLGEEGDGR